MIKLKNDKETRILVLQMENAIADKRWFTACANMNLETVGRWNCDWYKHMKDADERYSKAMEALIE